MLVFRRGQWQSVMFLCWCAGVGNGGAGFDLTGFPIGPAHCGQRSGLPHAPDSTGRCGGAGVETGEALETQAATHCSEIVETQAATHCSEIVETDTHPLLRNRGDRQTPTAQK